MAGQSQWVETNVRFKVRIRRQDCYHIVRKPHAGLNIFPLIALSGGLGKVWPRLSCTPNNTVLQFILKWWHSSAACTWTKLWHSSAQGNILKYVEPWMGFEPSCSQPWLLISTLYLNTSRITLSRSQTFNQKVSFTAWFSNWCYIFIDPGPL